MTDEQEWATWVRGLNGVSTSELLTIKRLLVAGMLKIVTDTGGNLEEMLLREWLEESHQFPRCEDPNCRVCKQQTNLIRRTKEVIGDA